MGLPRVGKCSKKFLGLVRFVVMEYQAVGSHRYTIHAQNQEIKRYPKNAQKLSILLGRPMGSSHPVWALAAIHPCWGYWYVSY